MSGVDTVIFDWGGTLTPWNSLDIHDGWRAYARAVHADDIGRSVELAAVLLAADDARWATVRDSHDAFTTAQVIADAAADPVEAALDAYREYRATFR